MNLTGNLGDKFDFGQYFRGNMKLIKTTAALASILFLAGCAAPGNLGANAGTSSDQIEVDEGLLTVDITLPASLMNMSGEKMTQKKVDELVADGGYISGKLNTDGSVTYTMTKLKQAEMLASTKKSFDDSIKQALSENPNIKSITRSDDFSEIRIEVAQEDMSAGFVGLGLALSAYFYQALDGKEYATDVVIADAKTGKEISRTSYPIKE